MRSAFTHGIDVSLLASTAIAAAGLLLALAFLPGTRRAHPTATSQTPHTDPAPSATEPTQ